jgi:hypothetical protein
MSLEAVGLSRHRIVAAGSEWVTPPDTADCEPTATKGTMALERFDGIRGATGIITAGRRKQMPERDLISSNTQNEQRPH